MHRSFVAELTARRHAIKHAWERKLRAEPITSPLANPDTLVLLMDRTLDDLLAAISLLARERGEGAGHARGSRLGCLCGLNPLLAYYRVGATVLATVSSQSAARCPELESADFHACVQETLAEFQAIAQCEIRAFCAMCQTELARAGKRAPGAPLHAVAQAGK